MSNTCKVCGGTDMNLVDGFYYCVECGTQDANVRETIVEMTVLADGTIAISDRKKLTTKLKEGIKMSGEWYKWHAYNFILVGLTEELISLGAAPTLKSKVLWIWTRYIKKFQNKKELGDASKLEDKTLLEDKESLLDDFENEDESLNTDHNAKFTKRKLLTILYIALNLDHSDIQLSHLFRFMKEGRLSFDINRKFIPTEIKGNYIPKYRVFQGGSKHKSDTNIRKYAMNYFKCLDLGIPLVPNLTRLVDHYMIELCLPLDLRDFILALIHLVPCDFLHIDELSMTYLVKLPNYEVIIMSYVLLALKICFGLDDDYEIKLSDAVDSVNTNENHPKSYNLGFHPEPSSRLFSFRDWYNYLHLRRVMLSKYYIHAGETYGLPSDDYILLEQLPKRFHKPPTFSDYVSMDILNKIHNEQVPRVIAKEEFPPSLTPITANLNVITPYIQDPDIKLLLCEDFSQYSLKYVTRDLKLPDFMLKGVSKNNKIINNFVVGSLPTNKWNIGKRMVYVRNCDNHNWLKTIQPSADHIKINKPGTFDDADRNEDGYNLNDDSNSLVGNAVDNNQTSYEEIEEESSGLNIFDDEFEYNTNEVKTGNNAESNINHPRLENEYFSEDNDDCTLPVGEIDRNLIIQELVEIASKKYKIPLPKDNTQREPRKRKIFAVIENNVEKLPKKRKNENTASKDVSRQPINDIISAYYEMLDKDALSSIAEGVRNIVQEVANENTLQNEPEENLLEENMSMSCVINETKSIGEENISNDLCATKENEDIAEDNISNDLCIINQTKEGNENEFNTDVTQENGHKDDSSLSDSNVILIPRINPDFDANTHITDQLYVKVERLNDVKVFDVCDENLENIIDKNMKEKEDCTAVSKSNEETTDGGETSDSGDDVPLSVYKEEKQYEANKRKFTNIDFEPLLRELNVSKYKFWIRHYKSKYFHQLVDRSNKRFEVEIKKIFPKSFVFILKECSSLVECSPFALYRTLQNLELRFMSHNN